jgi:hypothetical protein
MSARSAAYRAGYDAGWEAADEPVQELAMPDEYSNAQRSDFGEGFIAGMRARWEAERMAEVAHA